MADEESNEVRSFHFSFFICSAQHGQASLNERLKAAETAQQSFQNVALTTKLSPFITGVDAQTELIIVSRCSSKGALRTSSFQTAL